MTEEAYSQLECKTELNLSHHVFKLTSESIISASHTLVTFSQQTLNHHALTIVVVEDKIFFLNALRIEILLSMRLQLQLSRHLEI